MLELELQYLQERYPSINPGNIISKMFFHMSYILLCKLQNDSDIEQDFSIIINVS